MDFGVKYWPRFLPLRESELAKEVFVNVAENVLRVEIGLFERDVAMRSMRLLRFAGSSWSWILALRGLSSRDRSLCLPDIRGRHFPIARSI
jgi:hypothetical protein